jgi:hypothetical protein
MDDSTLEMIELSFQDIVRDSEMGKIAQDALRWLSQQCKEWLVLFYNADDPNMNLRKFMSPCGHRNVIETKCAICMLLILTIMYLGWILMRLLTCFSPPQ